MATMLMANSIRILLDLNCLFCVPATEFRLWYFRKYSLLQGTEVLFSRGKKWFSGIVENNSLNYFVPESIHTPFFEGLLEVPVKLHTFPESFDLKSPLLLPVIPGKSIDRVHMERRKLGESWSLIISFLGLRKSWWKIALICHLLPNTSLSGYLQTWGVGVLPYKSRG